VFDVLPNQWTAALPLEELDSNPKGFELAGEKLVAFADAAGAWHVLLDQCPHRRSALSLGSVTDEGHLRCGYHGWRFDGAGRCTMVPLNEVKESARKRIRATAFPSRVLTGALWVYTGPEADGEPQLPESLQGKDAAFDIYSQLWNAHWTRAVENFIDFAHPPYVHRDTFGVFSYEFAETGGTARVDTVETPFGCTMRNHLGGTGPISRACISGRATTRSFM
jgi:phenylpropionate dioxygenase-like ring-hydroxylating dioxygenase large terminal subunit